MLSDFRKKKLLQMFASYDADRNGYIERADLMALAARVLQAEPDGSDREAGLHSTYETLWDALSNKLDKNKDERVSPEEWLDFWEPLGTDGDGPEKQLLKKIADALFAVVDADGDGTISLQEFSAVTLGYRASAEATAEAFGVLDQDSDGTLTRVEWDAFVNEIFFSEEFGPGATAVMSIG